MKFTNVQLRHIGAIHECLGLLEKEINEFPVDVSSAGKDFVILQCVGPNSVAPEFRPQNKGDSVVYMLSNKFPSDKYEVKVVPKPSPHLVVRELEGEKTYYLYMNGPGVIKV